MPFGAKLNVPPVPQGGRCTPSTASPFSFTGVPMQSHVRISSAAALAVIIAFGAVGRAQSTTTVLVDVDHRKTQSLNGEWHYIVDPYDGGLYNFHREIRKDGFFLDGVPEHGRNGLMQYDKSKSTT